MLRSTTSHPKRHTESQVCERLWQVPLDKGIGMQQELNILFICTGNYYRSRFAEYYLRHVADSNNRRWLVTSRGLRLHAGNVGPISPHTREFCSVRGIKTDERPPTLLTGRDLAAANVAVAMSKTEHYPMMASMFPRQADDVLYWEIEDIPHQQPHVALAALIAKIESLAASLAHRPRSETN